MPSYGIFFFYLYISLKILSLVVFKVEKDDIKLLSATKEHPPITECFPHIFHIALFFGL